MNNLHQPSFQFLNDQTHSAVVLEIYSISLIFAILTDYFEFFDRRQQCVLILRQNNCQRKTTSDMERSRWSFHFGGMIFVLILLSHCLKEHS